MTTTAITEDQLKAAAKGAPVHVRTWDRYIRTYWAIDPAQEPDAHGCTDHAVLTVTFNKPSDYGVKGYLATLEYASGAFSEQGHREAIGIGQRTARVQVANIPAPRFNGKTFAKFAADALAQVQA